jgi:hypothetical protein
MKKRTADFHAPRTLTRKDMYASLADSSSALSPSIAKQSKYTYRKGREIEKRTTALPLTTASIKN